MNDTIKRIETRVMNQIAAFHEARHAADRWATVASKRTFVVRNGGRYFLADMADLRTYHRSDIHQGRAEIVHIGCAMPAAFGEPLDVEFAPIGW